MNLRQGLFRTADRVADLLGRLQGPFDSAALVETACRRAGNAPFHHPDMREALRVWLAALDAEADLSALGRAAAQWDVLRLLGNVLRLDVEEDADPTILGQAITRPVFVLGLPRAGTSFLHNLLATDPAVLAPRCWQMQHPWPIDPPGAPDRREAIADRQLRAFAHLAPEFPGLHPMRGNSTQECTEITAHCFRSLRFDTLHHVPSYRAWLDAAGHDEAYRFHRRFLLHLQRQAAPETEKSARWVLKCPDHVFAMAAIRAVYPDAVLVFVHRDPLKVLASVAKLTEVLRRPFTRHLDLPGIGRQVSAHWLAGATAMIAAGETPGGIHIQYRALVADPLGTARMLYDRCGLEWTPAVAVRMAEWATARPNGGYGAHSYRWEDHGLDPAALAEQFRPYLRHFAIEPETAFTGA